MVNKYVVRPTRVFKDKDKKPYIIFQGKRIYLKTSNKKLIRHILNKYFLKKKRKEPKKEAMKYIKSYIGWNLKSQIYGFWWDDLKHRIPDKPIVVRKDGKSKWLAISEFAKVLPELIKVLSIKDAGKPQIDVKDDGRIVLGLKNADMGEIYFRDYAWLQWGAPILARKLDEEIRRKQIEIEQRERSKLNKQIKARKIEQRKHIETDIRQRININENLINDEIMSNISKFNEKLKDAFFETPGD